MIITATRRNIHLDFVLQLLPMETPTFLKLGHRSELEGKLHSVTILDFTDFGTIKKELHKSVQDTNSEQQHSTGAVYRVLQV
jgi:hypothetical protein